MSNAISINNSVLMGRLTRDPELRYTKNNRPVATFKLAISRRSNAEVTDFIPCVALGGTAEFAARWFQKGTLAIVIGQLTSRVWQDETDGRNRIAYEILCDSVQFGETKKAAHRTGAAAGACRVPSSVPCCAGAGTGQHRPQRPADPRAGFYHRQRTGRCGV